MRRALAALLLFVASCSSGELRELRGRYIEVDEKGDLELRCEEIRGEAVTPFTLKFRPNDIEFENIDYLIKGSPLRVSYYGKVRDNRLQEVASVWVDPRYCELTGRWIEVGEGAYTQGEGMGFELMAGGNALTIGMQTVIFNKWDYREPSTLILAGHCYDTGHGNTISFSEEWSIDHFDGTTLNISTDNLSLNFRRQIQTEEQDSTL